MRFLPRTLALAAAAAAMLATPAVSAARASVPQPPANAWTTLSELNPAGAMALGGGTSAATRAGAMNNSAATVQPTEPNDRRRRAVMLPWPVMTVLMAVLGTMIYIALIEDNGPHRPRATSPQ